MNREKSKALFEQARKIIPGGVNSPVRACASVGTEPVFIEKGNGAVIFDADGNSYIDYVGSWGPMILGHAHPSVVQSIVQAAQEGTSFGAPTEMETRLAQMVVDAVPSVEMVRMVNSGTEATMSAIRLARGYTGRDIIIKFDGCYHGHADTLLVQAGSGVATLNIPGSPGVPKSFVEYTLSLPFNDIEILSKVMAEKGDKVAAIIVEPLAGNMGMVPPVPGFLQALRDLTRKHGAFLIFDEVMTGFRVAYGGAQEKFGITPDLTCLGKVIGGGLPVGAYGGRREIMEKIAPQGPVYQAGTLSGNPLAMAAGIATLTKLKEPGVYEALEERAGQLINGLLNAAEDAGIPATGGHMGAMLGLFFTDKAVRSFEDAKKSDTDRFSAYYRKMMGRGIYLAPSPFEAFFLSTAHKEEHIEATLAAAGDIFRELAP